MTIWVGLACNDYRNGDFTGKATAIHIGDALELEPTLLYGGLSVRRGGDSIRLGRLKMHCFGYRTWYGNWCWDAVRIGIRDAAKLANYLKKNGWQCTGGLCDVCDKWEAGALTADDLREPVEAGHEAFAVAASTSAEAGADDPASNSEPGGPR